MNIDVAVIMGSISDYETMKETCALLDQFQIGYEKKVISAHRTPKLMMEYAENCANRNIKCIIAAAGGAAHLPGMVAANTYLPVIGVPIKSSTLNGVDSLLSIVQMPAGVPVATMAIGVAGAKNAAIFAANILGLTNQEVKARIIAYKKEMETIVLEKMVL